MDGSVSVDGCKLKGHFSVVLTVNQLCLNSVLNIKCRNAGVNCVKTAVGLNKAHGCFLANALYTGNIVACITHESLQINDAARLKAVFLKKYGGGIVLCFGFAHAGLDVLNARIGCNELKAVLVTGNDDAFVAVFFAYSAYRSDEVIRLIALKLYALYCRGVQNLL